MIMEEALRFRGYRRRRVGDRRQHQEVARERIDFRMSSGNTPRTRRWPLAAVGLLLLLLLGSANNRVSALLQLDQVPNRTTNERSATFTYVCTPLDTTEDDGCDVKVSRAQLCVCVLVLASARTPKGPTLHRQRQTHQQSRGGEFSFVTTAYDRLRHQKPEGGRKLRPCPGIAVLNTGVLVGLDEGFYKRGCCPMGRCYCCTYSFCRGPLVCVLRTATTCCLSDGCHLVGDRMRTP